jgi:hypothetical protein
MSAANRRDVPLALKLELIFLLDILRALATFECAPCVGSARRASAAPDFRNKASLGVLP